MPSAFLYVLPKCERLLPEHCIVTSTSTLVRRIGGAVPSGRCSTGVLLNVPHMSPGDADFFIGDAYTKPFGVRNLDLPDWRLRAWSLWFSTNLRRRGARARPRAAAGKL